MFSGNPSLYGIGMPCRVKIYAYVCRMEKMERNDFGVSRRLRAWYEENRRDLPWRATRSPYLIWVSEIILQQTRVDQGLAYYLRFVGRFPDVASLAAADEDEVLRYWQGLGYYSRARNLRAAAIDVMTRFGGVFPKRYEDVRSLKGVGEYTAAAIVSFAWNEPKAVVDGNVYRVLARLFAVETPIDTGEGKRLFAALAADVMDPREAATHNQAIMELGALVCSPRDPSCDACPLVTDCLAHAVGRERAFPVKRGRVKRRSRFFLYLYIIYKGRTWLRRREPGDIWAGLYEFPMVETERAVAEEEVATRPEARALVGEGFRIVATRMGVKHVLSHQDLFLSFLKIEITEPTPALKAYLETPVDALPSFAMPQPLHQYCSREGREGREKVSKG